MSDLKPAFAGSVPENYERYLVPLIFEDYAQDLAARVKVPANGSVLETACGTGVVTRQLRKALPDSVKLVATDLSPGMFEVAQKKLAPSGNLEYQAADATALPFEGGRFDAMVCQYGVMFYPDKALGYREALRVLKPGGTYLFNVWDSPAKNPFIECIFDTVTSLCPNDPPPFMKIPFGYHDIAGIKTEVLKAGFEMVEAHVLQKESRAPSTRDAAIALTAGSPLAAQLAERGLTETAGPAVEKALTERFGSGPIKAPMQAIVFEARKAG